MSLHERKNVVTGRKYVSTDRKYGSKSSFQRAVNVLKTPAATRNVEPVITKKPVLYGKLDYQADDTLANKKSQRPVPTKVTESAPKESPVNKESLESPSVEPTLDGHYELNPLLSKMLEAELEDVMSKILKFVPTDLWDDAENLVAERFRNKAGNDLRNTIGLNVTKRLLNVHNPLYVKIVITSKPTHADLMNFIKKHNISAFKSVGNRGGLFAAKMHNFQDFDDLCTNKNLKCGKASVTVTPCYQFMKCPPNLRTPYDGSETNTVSKKDENNFEKKPVPVKTDSPGETKPTEKDSKIQQNVAILSKQNVPPKVAPKLNEPVTDKVATDTTPSKEGQAGSVNEVAQTQTNKNKQIAAKVTPAATQMQSSGTKVTSANVSAVTQTQNATPKVTPAKQPGSTQAQNSTAKDTVAKQPAATQAQNPTPKAPPTKQPAATQAQNPAPKSSPTKQPAATQAQNPAPKAPPTKQSAATQAKNSTPKATPNKQPAVTQTQNSTPKATPNKQPAVTQTQNSTPAKSPASIQAQNAASKATPAKQAGSTQAQNPASKSFPTKPATVNNQNAAPKVAPSKPITANNTKTPAQVKKAVTATKPSAAPKATPPKSAVIQIQKTKLKQISPKKINESDFDELDDHDILALITEGIVLDECSGSEEE